MKFDLFDIQNYNAFGELIKIWAQDKNTRPPDGALAVLATALNNAQVGASFAGRNYTKFRIIDQPTTPDELVLIIPPTGVLVSAEQDVTNNGYQLPDFYKDTFNTPLNVPEAERKPFHSRRIGEYTMKFCL